MFHRIESKAGAKPVHKSHLQQSTQQKAKIEKQSDSSENDIYNRRTSVLNIQ